MSEAAAAADSTRVVSLGIEDLDEIMQLERIAFPAELQAKSEIYSQRFALGHIALGWRKEGGKGLAGIISFSYGTFDQAFAATIPPTFDLWSMQGVPAGYDTAFIYNLGVAPEVRGTKVHRELVRAAFDRIQRDGCLQVIAEGPIPSYQGNTQVAPHPGIRAALDRMAAGYAPPDEELLFEDPHLALYRRLCPCRIIQVMPGFLPSDTASGGFRAMLFRDLRLSEKAEFEQKGQRSEQRKILMATS